MNRSMILLRQLYLSRTINMGKINISDLMGKSIYIDTNFFIYFFEKHDQYFRAIESIITSCDNGDIFGYVGDAVISELLVKPLREWRSDIVIQLRSFFARKNFLTRVSHDAAIFDSAAQLRAQHGMKFIDALHYATALSGWCEYILTNDYGFPGTGSLTIISAEDLK